VYRYLDNDRASIRLLALWLLCAILFVISWELSYDFLPLGVLRGKLLGSVLPVETSDVVTTFLRIFVTNMIVGCGLVTGANLTRVGRLPLGYMIVMIHSVLYAVLLGTNSFGIRAAERLAPSLMTAVGGSGAFEITAYILVAAATSGNVVWKQRSWLSWHSERVGSPRTWRLSPAEWGFVVAAILLLAAANFREATHILRLVAIPVTAFGH